MSENTLEAFVAAQRAGVDWMETDVHTSADGILFAAHDADLDRIAGRPHRIGDLNAAELDSVDLHAGGRLPRLTTLFESLPDAAWNIDVKAADSIAPMIRVVRSLKAEDRIRLASFSSATLRRLREALPGVRTSSGVAETAMFAAGGLPGVDASGLCRLPPGLDALQVPMSFKGVPLVTEDFVSRAHHSGLQVHVWTINEPASMRVLLDLGVDGIVTDEVVMGLRELVAWT